jgi:hypothetical protein
MAQKERAHQNGGPIPDHLSSQDAPDTAENLESRQARILTQRFAIGYRFAAELALIVWGTCPR